MGNHDHDDQGDSVLCALKRLLERFDRFEDAQLQHILQRLTALERIGNELMAIFPSVVAVINRIDAGVTRIEAGTAGGVQEGELLDALTPLADRIDAISPGGGGGGQPIQVSGAVWSEASRSLRHPSFSGTVVDQSSTFEVASGGTPGTYGLLGKGADDEVMFAQSIGAGEGASEVAGTLNVSSGFQGFQGQQGGYDQGFQGRTQGYGTASRQPMQYGNQGQPTYGRGPTYGQGQFGQGGQSGRSFPNPNFPARR